MSSRFLQSEPGDEPVIVEALFKAPVTRVFDAWTQPDKIMQWFGPRPGSLISADVDLRVGGKWQFILSSDNGARSILAGRYSQVSPGKCLQFSWSHVQEAADGTRQTTPESTVTVDFAAEGSATRVRLRHENINQRDGRQGVGHGWETTFGHLEQVFGTSSQ